MSFYLIFLLLFSFNNLAIAEEEENDGFNKIRIENEFKLRIPENIVNDVNIYLHKTYGPNTIFFNDFDSTFTTENEIEIFEDIYYDNSDFIMLNQQGGIRHRMRYDLKNDEKTLQKELIQIKLQTDDEHGVNRQEIKFPLTNNYSEDDELIDKIKKSNRKEFETRLKELQINKDDLEAIVKVIQKRTRIYILYKNESFATITMDEVSSEKWWKSISFVELEMEINEIGYTEASPEKKAFMEKVNSRMKEDLLNKFTEIKQDQTPKYNKVFNHFDEASLWSSILINYNPSLSSVIGTAVAIILILLFVFLKNKIGK